MLAEVVPPYAHGAQIRAAKKIQRAEERKISDVTRQRSDLSDSLQNLDLVIIDDR
jgi:hypothetical protein